MILKKEFVKNATVKLIQKNLSEIANAFYGGAKNMSRLKQKYDKEILKVLQSEFDIKNLLSAPRVLKVVVNMGIGAAIKNKELITKAAEDMAAITGQKPSVREAKISVASFSLRKGMKVGLKTTLRGERMYDFLDKLFSIVLPRLRDFRGLSKKSFDSQANYTIGISDNTVFPEMDLAKTNPLGLEITIVTNPNENEQAAKLLTLLGMPFEKGNST